MLLIDGLAPHPTDCKPLKGPIFDCISLPTDGSQRLVDAEGSDRVAFVHGDVRDHGYLKMVRDTAGKPRAKSPCDSQRQQFLKEGYSTSSAHPISSSPPLPQFFCSCRCPRAFSPSRHASFQVWGNRRMGQQCGRWLSRKLPKEPVEGYGQDKPRRLDRGARPQPSTILPPFCHRQNEWRRQSMSDRRRFSFP